MKVAFFGLGPIGLESLRQAAGYPGLEVVGAVDRAPHLVGRTLTELTGLGSLDGLVVARDLEELFRETPPDLILHAASSRVLKAVPQIRPALELGVSVVSSCEELVFPALKAPQLVREIDGLCRHTGARLVATGVNPGFVMDVLPLCASGLCLAVQRVRVERVVDAATRRRSLQEKIGCGMPFEEFAEKMRQGGAGHAGLPESVALLAHALRWTLDEITQVGEPVVATQELCSEFFRVRTGEVCGIHQRATGWCGGEAVIELDLRMALGVVEPHDHIRLEGKPPLGLTVPGGVPGDVATVACLLNAVPRLMAAAPGLHLAPELPLPQWTGNFSGASRNLHR